jgi:hypothetical protein
MGISGNGEKPCPLTTRSSGPESIVGRVWPRHGHRGRPLNSVVRRHVRGERIDWWMPFLLTPGARYDHSRSMSLRGHSLGELRAPDRDAGVLVQGLPIPRCRQRNRQRLLPYRIVHRNGPDQRLSKCREQWQPNAPTILLVVRDATLQRGRGASSSDLCPRRDLRRSESRQSCGDDLDVVRATLGQHRRGVAASGESATAGGVMSDA